MNLTYIQNGEIEIGCNGSRFRLKKERIWKISSAVYHKGILIPGLATQVMEWANENVKEALR